MKWICVVQVTLFITWVTVGHSLRKTCYLSQSEEEEEKTLERKRKCNFRRHTFGNVLIWNTLSMAASSFRAESTDTDPVTDFLHWRATFGEWKKSESETADESESESTRRWKRFICLWIFNEVIQFIIIVIIRVVIYCCRFWCLV